jgi:retron-type reverse transcriptase
VWEAYKRVKANRGAAGADGQTIEQFEEDLSNNLYKLWNRLASGSYMPRAVRRVEIPKADGGMRPLGIPTIADRVAQTVVKQHLEPKLEEHFHEDSYGYRPGSRRDRRWTVPGAAAGTTRGSWTSTSRGSSTRSIMSC